MAEPHKLLPVNCRIPREHFSFLFLLCLSIGFFLSQTPDESLAYSRNPIQTTPLSFRKIMESMIPGPGGRENEGIPMSRIAVIITDMFQDVEYQKPAEAFQKAGHELIHVGLKAGSLVKGEHGAVVKIDKAVRDVSASDFDALFIPGGYSPDKLRIDPDAVRFAKDFMNTNKPVFAICHAAQLLITAQVLKGRRVTGWMSIIQDIKNAGAEYVDADVVVDNYYRVYQPSSKELQTILTKHKSSDSFFLELVLQPVEITERDHPYIRHLVTQIRKKIMVI